MPFLGLKRLGRHDGWSNDCEEYKFDASDKDESRNYIFSTVLNNSGIFIISIFT